MNQTSDDFNQQSENTAATEQPVGEHASDKPSAGGFIRAYLNDRRLLGLAIGLILVAGLSSLMVLPRMEDPLLAPRAASVTTVWPGADAGLVETLITEKIEDELKKVKEIKEIRSASRPGVSFIQIELLDSVTATQAPAVWSRIRGKIDDSEVYFPPNTGRPLFEEVDVKAYAILVSLQWESQDPNNPAILRRLARVLEERIRSLPGTEKVDVFGSPQEEIIVEIDPEKAASLGLTAAQVSAQIEARDTKLSAGQVRNKRGDLLLEVTDSIDNLTQIGQIPIQLNQQGVTVEVSDIADIKKGFLDPPETVAITSGLPAVVLGALVRDDVRIDFWVQQVVPALKEFETELPRDVSMNLLFNQSEYVERRLQDLGRSLLLGGAAVLLVIFFMMGLRSAIVVGAALPLASLMVLAGLRWMDIPIHQMSVTGLIVALGLLIDNAIVMVDEVAQEIREGMAPLDAANRAVRLLGIPLFGSTLTTGLAFGPIALMPGPAGEFVGAIAISVILAVASSFFLAMTILPALAYLTIKPNQSSRHWWNSGFRNQTLTDIWSRFLTLILRRPLVGISISVVLPILGFIAAGQLPEQFFPPADRDQIHIEVELAAGTSITETTELVDRMRSDILQIPGVVDVHWFIGESAPIFYYNLIPTRKNASRYAQAFVQCEHVADQKFVRNLQTEISKKYPQALTLARLLEQGPPFYAPIEIRIFGSDTEILKELGDQVRLALAETPSVIATRSELSESLIKVNFDIDKAQIRLVGLDPAQIAGQLNSALEGITGGSVLESTEELAIRVRIGNDQRADLNQVATFSLLQPTMGVNSDPMRQDSDRLAYLGIPLASIADMKLDSDPAGIPRLNGSRMNEVQAFLQAGQLAAGALDDFEIRLAQSNFHLPPGYRMEYGGEAAKRDDAIGNLLANVGVLVVLMIATLVLSFQSFRLAMLIGVIGCLSVGLGMGALWVYGFPFGFMAIIGTMGLMGVAINDSIVVLAAIRGNAAARAGDRIAIREVVVRSSRHIFSTTLTTTAGFMPLILAGGGFWPPLAVAVSGGIIGATILALVMVPSAYAITHRPPEF